MVRLVVRIVGLVAFASICPLAWAQAQNVSLPFIVRDELGSNWDIQFDGSIGDGGNDLYDGGGRLFVNSNMQYVAPNQTAIHDPQNNEFVFPPMQMQQLNVWRRVKVFPKLGAVRFVEMIQNPTNQSQRVQIRAYFNMGSMVQQALPLQDPRRATGPVGHAIADQSNAVAMIGGGRGSKVLPRMQFTFNNDNVDLFYTIDVPPQQTVAVAHVQLRRRTAQDAAEAWNTLREKDLLADLPAEIRRRLVNWSRNDLLPPELDLLRGDGMDVIEVRGGDQFRGLVKRDQLALRTNFGPVTIPMSRVLGAVNIGVYSPMYLVATVDGDVIAGRIEGDAIRMEVGGGQSVLLSLSQIRRIGMQKRHAEPEEWSLENRAVVFTAGGQRVCIRPPESPIELSTSLGTIKVPAETISSILFQDDGLSVPELRLKDGSRLSAFLQTPTFDVDLVSLDGQRARLPVPSLTRIVLSPEADPERFSPALLLHSRDMLVGTIEGTFSVQTPYDTIHVEGPQIKSITRAQGAQNAERELQITLWDDTVIGGRMRESHVTCLTRTGLRLRVPTALIQQYNQPLPTPSPSMVRQIREMVAQLDAPDYRIRQRAQQSLIAIGPPVIGELQTLRKAAQVESGQRINHILGQLIKQLDRGASNTLGAPGISGENAIEFQQQLQGGAIRCFN